MFIIFASSILKGADNFWSGLCKRTMLSMLFHFNVSFFCFLSPPQQKYDYDSSTVRKKFFREALLQIFIPYMLKQLSPSCSAVRHAHV